MKNIIKKLMIITVGVLTAFSCTYDDNNFAALTEHTPDANATYFVQFKEAQKSLKVKIDPASGDTVEEIQTSIVVAILGLPLDQDLTVNLTLNPGSTTTPNMYVLGASSIVIPAGTVSGSTTLTSVSENMPVDEVVTLVLNVDAGEHNATAGTTLTYDLFRPAPCIPVPGVYTIDMIDSYGDGWQTNDGNGGDGITVTVDGVLIAEFGMCSPYQASPFTCTPGTSSAQTTVTIAEGSLSAIWSFPGDQWGEIGFTITDPLGNTYKVNPGEGVAGTIPLTFCVL
jgi:hypothetical protein